MSQRLLLISPRPEFEEQVRRAFAGELNGSLSSWWGRLNGDREQSVRELVNGSDVVAVGPGIEPAAAVELASMIDRLRPDLGVVIVAEPSPELLEAALRAGVRDVIAPDTPDETMREKLQWALDAADARRSALTPTHDAEDSGRRVITVLSPKGGTGKTTVSTNLALGLARTAPGEVVILDLDLQFGDVAHTLHLAPEHTFADAARASQALDATTLKMFLTPHPRDFFALCASPSPADADDLTPQDIEQVIELLTQEFRFVVVDTGSGLDEATLVALQASTDLVLLATPDVPSVRATQKEVEILSVLCTPGQRHHFVLNRADVRAGLSIEDIETTVGLPIEISIPNSRGVPLSINQGSPLVESDPRSPASAALLKLVKQFAGLPVSPKGASSGGRFRRRTS